MDRNPVVPRGFDELGLEQPLIDAIGRLGIDAPTEVQKQMIPAVLAGRDCLTQVRSGSGKTNAYMLPLIHLVKPGGGLQALVVMPTRGAAQQLQTYFFKFVDEGTLNIALVARGGLRPPRDVVQGRAEIVIATARGAEELGRVGLPPSLRWLVVDDIDTIFDIDGPEALDSLFDDITHPVQKMLVTATMSDPVRTFAERRLSDPKRVEIPETPAVQRVSQQYTTVEPDQAVDTVITILKQARPRLALVFCNSEATARDLIGTFERVRIPARWIDDPRQSTEDQDHGPPRGHGRERRGGGRGGDGPEAILTADPARRRLGTIPATMLIHFELPEDAQTYAARLSNCDRLARRGYSLALATTEQRPLIDAIQALAGRPLEAVGPFERPPRAEGRGRRDGERTGGHGGRGDHGGRGGQGGHAGGDRRSSSGGAATAPTSRSADDLAGPGADAHGQPVRQPLPKTLGSRFPVRKKPPGFSRPSA